MTATLDSQLITPTTAVDSNRGRRSTCTNYANIHKGIRAELFRVTTLAGNMDPASAAPGSAWPRT